jgi:hypothetical protein
MGRGAELRGRVGGKLVHGQQFRAVPGRQQARRRIAVMEKTRKRNQRVAESG